MKKELPRIGEYSQRVHCVANPPRPAGAARIRSFYALAGRPGTIRKVLVVDDAYSSLKSCAVLVRDTLKVPVLMIDLESRVPIREQVRRIIAAESPDLVLIDGELSRPGKDQELTGIKLIQEMREAGFMGYIVANSSDPVDNWEMTRKGADFSTNEEFYAQTKEVSLAIFLKEYFA